MPAFKLNSFIKKLFFTDLTKTKQAAIIARLFLILFFILAVEILCSNKVYYPTTAFQDTYPEIKNKIQNVTINTPDREKLNGWYIKAKSGKPTFILCHGNGGNISFHQEMATILADNGYGILLFDYRGYGKSTGSPSEIGTYTDAESAINYLNNNENINNSQIITWGHSLGGAVALELATKHKFKAIILSSTFTSVQDMAFYVLNSSFNKNNIKPVKYIFKGLAYILPLGAKYDNLNKINSIKSPILIAHDIPDEVIPVEMSYKLAEHNSNAKIFFSQNGSHNELFWIKEKLLAFIKSLPE